MATTAVDLTGLDIVSQAMQEAGILDPTEAPSGEDGMFVLTKINRILDAWNAQSIAIYTSVLTSVTLAPNVGPQLIGPIGSTPTLTIPQRPVRIEDANQVIGIARSPIVMRETAWWMQQSTPTLAGGVLTDLYYEPDWPNGKLFFWPVPSGALVVELLTRLSLDALTFPALINLPTGYRDALILTVAESLVTPFGIQMPQGLPESARKARAIVFALNDPTPTLDTRIPGAQRRFDYRIGR